MPSFHSATSLTVVVVVVVLSCGLFAVAQADVSSLRYNRFGRTQSTRLQRLQEAANPTPYPAAGFRPDRQFGLPSLQESQSAHAFAQDEQGANIEQQAAQRPEQIYGAPARQQLQPQQDRQQPQQQPQQQQQPHLTYAAPQLTYAAPAAETFNNADDDFAQQSQRLRKAKPARLTANREDLDDEDEEDTREDIDVDSKVEVNNQAAQPQPQPQPQPPAGAGTVTYFPAGAVSFVHPVSAAYSLPATNIFARVQAQPTFYAAATPQPRFVAQPFVQPQTTTAAAYFAAPALQQLQAW